ncbi:MAG: signal recognition particle-docking protein FtsY [Candidatus Heimdallarchaeota archaeon]|nr:signal recognition particle-docking protein FtsY [Candidatus Heimdallarchaeota archaeon]
MSEKDLKPIVDDLINLMIENEIGHESAEIIGKELIAQLISIEHTRFKTAKPLVREALRNSIAKILEVDESRQVNLFEMIEEAKSEGRPFIICILGINGTGKTTTIAKLTKLFQNKNYSVVLAAGDTYRSGSIQQLGKHADNLGVRMIAHDYGGDPAAVAIDAIDHAEAKNIDIVLIDTAGRMQNNINLIRELEKIIRLSEPDLRIFIGDSLAGNDVIRQVKQFDKDVGIDGIIMTKVDADVKGGAVITVTHAANRPVLYVGNGQGYDHLVEFDPNLIVNQVIPN